MKKINAHILQYGITILSLIIAFLHIMFPNLKIDAVTITLLLIALVPWLSPLFKSIVFPGGWKIEFQEIKEQLGTMIAKQAEPITETAGLTFGLKAHSVNDEPTRLVLKSLGNPDYTWRTFRGISAETKLSSKQIIDSMSWLLDNKLATEVREKQGNLWGLSADGRNLFRNIFRDASIPKKANAADEKSPEGD